MVTHSPCRKTAGHKPDGVSASVLVLDTTDSGSMRHHRVTLRQPGIAATPNRVATRRRHDATFHPPCRNVPPPRCNVPPSVSQRCAVRVATLRGPCSNVALTRNNVAPTRNNVASIRNNVALTRNNVAPTRNNVALTRNNVALTRNNVAPTRNSVAPNRNNVALTRNNVAPTRNNVALSARGARVCYCKRYT